MLIGICGRKFSGKDTIADILVKYFGFQKTAFAYGLKETCKVLFLLTEEQLHTPHLKEVVDPRWNLSPRHMFQMVGTNWVRDQLDKDFWVKRTKMHIETMITSCEHVVVPDVRFLNEKELIESMGGIVIGVRRTPTVVHDDLHESEIMIDSLLESCYPIIENDQDVISLETKIISFMKCMTKNDI